MTTSGGDLTQRRKGAKTGEIRNEKAFSSSLRDFAALRETPRLSGFLFDLNACTGCNACQLACSTENELGWDKSWRQVITYNPDRIPSLPRYHLSLACNHCAQAPCMKHCPARAIRRDGRTGAVLIDPDRCIGCGYCSWVCPYDAPVFDQDEQVMTKCTWCNHRLMEGRSPACVEQCPTGALGFGPLQGESVVAGFPDTPAEPAIRFRPLSRKPVETTWQPPQQATQAAIAPPSKIQLGSEWPLLVFTLLSAALVGWLLASLNSEIRVDPLIFLSLAGLGAGASTLHLGRKQRAWRAVLNWRGSWLSREVVTFGAFTSSTAGMLLVLPESWTARLICALLGLAHLFCVDRVYDPVRPQAGKPLHSSDTFLTAVLLAALLRGDLTVYCLIGGLKLLLFLSQWLRQEHAWAPGSALTGFLRLAAIAFPAALLLLDPQSNIWLSLAAFAIGETIDRAQFYRRLEVISPTQQAALAL